MIFLIIFAVLFSSETKANFNDFFGTGVTTSIIGGQSNGRIGDPNNIYYSPAIHAWNQNINLVANLQSVSHDFKDINNIVTKNSTNNTNSSSQYTERSNVKVDYPDYKNNVFGVILPIKSQGAGNLAATYSGPVGSIIEANTGNPTAPEYVMYHSRYRRSMIEVHYAHPFSENFALSLGTKIGLQTGADVNTQASLSGTGYGSSGAAKAKVGPSMAGIFSAALKFESLFTYFLFSQEMKQYLHTNVNGEINDPPAPFDVTVDSMLYYDPYTFRIGGGYKTSALDLLASVEYQLWSGYRTPVMHITKKTFIVSSNDYEKINTKNIFIPRLGTLIHFGESFDWGIGALYRPTPLKGDFSGAGNSIDTNTYALSTGPLLRMKIFNKEIETGLSFQSQKLENKIVTKSTRQENGNTGDKIGAPGFTVGGKILTYAVGIKITL